MLPELQRGLPVSEEGQMEPMLEADLERVNDAGIPTDIVFEQGTDILGL